MILSARDPQENIFKNDFWFIVDPGYGEQRTTLSAAKMAVANGPFNIGAIYLIT